MHIEASDRNKVSRNFTISFSGDCSLSADEIWPDEIASRINPEHAEMPKKEQKWTGDSHLKAGLKDSEDVHITKGLTS